MPRGELGFGAGCWCFARGFVCFARGFVCSARVVVFWRGRFGAQKSSNIYRFAARNRKTKRETTRCLQYHTPRRNRIWLIVHILIHTHTMHWTFFLGGANPWDHSIIVQSGGAQLFFSIPWLTKKLWGGKCLGPFRQTSTIIGTPHQHLW